MVRTLTARAEGGFEGIEAGSERGRAVASKAPGQNTRRVLDQTVGLRT